MHSDYVPQEVRKLCTSLGIEGDACASEGLSVSVLSQAPWGKPYPTTRLCAHSLCAFERIVLSESDYFESDAFVRVEVIGDTPIERPIMHRSLYERINAQT